MVVGEFTQETTLAVIGGGAGGYAAALRAAELDVPTIVIDPQGACPHLTWLASKTVADAAMLSVAADHAAGYGLVFEDRRLNLSQLQQWIEQVSDVLTTQLERSCTERGVELIRGLAEFTGPRQLTIHNGAGARIRFKHAIIATGSSALPPPGGWRESSCVTGPGGVLRVDRLPKTMLVIGGESAALETASAFAGLGSRVTLVAPGERLLEEADLDLLRQLERALNRRLEHISLATTVTAMHESSDSVEVELAGPPADAGTARFEHIVVALGARPRTEKLCLAKAKIDTGPDGQILVDEQLRTSNRRVLAVGDVLGGPTRANLAMHQGRAAAEIVSGLDIVFEPRAVPGVIFTDPPLAWCGLTESQAIAQGIAHEVYRADWSASGRALSLAQTDGLTKLIVEPESELVLGMGIAGASAPEMISQGVLAVEMGAVIDDLAAIIHAHPSLSELIAQAARQKKC